MISFLKKLQNKRKSTYKLTYIATLLLIPTLLYSFPAISQSTSKISFKNQLVDATDSGNEGEVISLIRSGHPIESRGDFGVTPLMRAAFRGYSRIAKILINLGADVDAVDLGGATALHIASRQNKLELVKILLASDASIDAPDNDGWTPLMRASASSKDGKIIELLLKKGANPYKRNKLGQNAFMQAIQSNNVQGVRILAPRISPSLTKLDIDKIKQFAKNHKNPEMKQMLHAYFKGESITTDTSVANINLPSLNDSSNSRKSANAREKVLKSKITTNSKEKNYIRIESSNAKTASKRTRKDGGNFVIETAGVKEFLKSIFTPSTSPAPSNKSYAEAKPKYNFNQKSLIAEQEFAPAPKKTYNTNNSIKPKNTNGTFVEAPPKKSIINVEKPSTVPSLVASSNNDQIASNKTDNTINNTDSAAHNQHLTNESITPPPAPKKLAKVEVFEPIRVPVTKDPTALKPKELIKANSTVVTPPLSENYNIWLQTKPFITDDKAFDAYRRAKTNDLFNDKKLKLVRLFSNEKSFIVIRVAPVANNQEAGQICRFITGSSNACINVDLKKYSRPRKKDDEPKYSESLTKYPNAHNNYKRRTKKYWLQLGSVKSLSKAEQYSKKLQKKYPNLFGDQNFYFVSPKNDPSIIRVRIGPFVSSSRAETMCKELSERNITCIKVKD
jgi:ankyrin repeat protein